MNSTITMGKEYKEMVYKGVKKAVDVIKLTYGYNGKYVKIDNGDEYKNDITKDGYKVSQQIYSDDPVEDIGCEIIRQATKMTEIKIKNGTTTTAILIGGLIDGMVNLPDNVNILDVKESIKKLSQEIIDYTTGISKKTDNAYDIAFGSCHDKEMAEFVVNMMEKHDEFYETSPYYSDEYKIDYNNNKRKVPLKFIGTNGKTNINNPYVMVFDSAVLSSNVKEFSNSIFGWIKGKNVVLIVRQIDEGAAGFISAQMNEHDGDIMLFSTYKKQGENINFISDFYNKKSILLANKRLLINVIDGIKNFSSDGIITGIVHIKDVDLKIDKLKKQISEGHNDHRADIIRKEINDYMGRIYKVSLKSNAYNFEGQKDKFLDVVNDIISLRKSNGRVVYGGGVVFKDAANHILKFKNNELLSKEFLLAVDILAETLFLPINVILSNSYTGKTHLAFTDIGAGYNAYDGSYHDIMPKNIVTPLVSFINTINVAKDIATEWLLTDASIVVENNNNKEIE